MLICNFPWTYNVNVLFKTAQTTHKHYQSIFVYFERKNSTSLETKASLNCFSIYIQWRQFSYENYLVTFERGHSKMLIASLVYEYAQHCQNVVFFQQNSSKELLKRGISDIHSIEIKSTSISTKATGFWAFSFNNNLLTYFTQNHKRYHNSIHRKIEFWVLH